MKKEARELTKIAFEDPSLREDLLPIIEKLSSRSDYDQFALEVEDLIRRHWPDSEVKVQAQTRHKPAIFIVFTLWKKEDWPNRIINNDPLHTHIWIWDIDQPIHNLEISLGKTLSGYNGKTLGKTGWRNAKGDRAKVLRTLDKYFGQKLKAVVAAYQEELDEALQLYRDYDLRRRR